MSKSQSRFFGQAGEYYALFRLWEEKVVALMAPPGERRVDILVYNHGYNLAATVQVKTRSTKDRVGWLVNKKQLGFSNETHFYIFVELDRKAKGLPTSYVVPSLVVAELGKHLMRNDPKIAAVIGEDIALASSDPKYLNFAILKPVLEEPHPILGDKWPDRFDNAYWLLTEPIFQFAANQLVNRKKNTS
jgi:hypothetical protein